MLKKDLFIKAMQAKKYKRLPWIVSAFAITKEDPNSYKTNPTDFKIVSDLTGYFVANPNKELEKIEDAVLGQPLFTSKEKVTITPEDIPNLKDVVETTYGRLLFNWLCLVEPFGTKIPYQNSKIKLSKIEDSITAILTDIPEDNNRLLDKIYVDEYLRYTQCIFFLTGLSQLFSQGITEKVMLAPPGIKEFKQKLIKENISDLNNMATIAKIDKQLVEYDAAYLKGDDGENFLISGKSRNIVRKKLYLMHGGEVGLDENNIKTTLIQNSLSEGWDVSKFPAMNDSLRAGSFNRGAQTELGGVSVKWLLRASSNINVPNDDCGSNLGVPELIVEENKARLVGFTLIANGQSVKMNEESEVGPYLGKTLMVRSPMYCKLSFTDYCKVCVGDRLALNPTGLSIAVSSYGSVLLNVFMQGAHARSLELAKMNIRKSIF